MWENSEASAADVIEENTLSTTVEFLRFVALSKNKTSSRCPDIRSPTSLLYLASVTVSWSVLGKHLLG